MVTDGQVRKLWKLLAGGKTLAFSARKTGMDEKTARKYRDTKSLPSQRNSSRDYRTREDPFVEVWHEVQLRLEQEPRLRSFALWDWLKIQYPDKFMESQRRTFERRVRAWRSEHGPDKEVMFSQIHPPGGLAASDFTNMNSLGITIDGQPFDHLLFHCTLTYSNWESVSICQSESFEALSHGLQNAFWEMGGVPRKHRTDSLSAAVNNLSAEREFRKRYAELMDHYQLEAQKTNARKAHENGDVESSHGHLKADLEQALLLRGSRDFIDRDDYEKFLKQRIGVRNAARRDKFEREQSVLGDLPPQRLDHVRRLAGIKVCSGCTIQVKRNTYSVPSRLIGYRVDVVIDVEQIEVWHADHLVQRMPRLSGSGKHAINYRHIIDSLVRKPGAFENYKYREDLFPTSHFRMAYDWLCEHHSARVALRQYLKILQSAARDSQDAVQGALRLAIAAGTTISADAIQLAIENHQQIPSATDVNIEPPNLNDFDSLLQHPDMEVENDDGKITQPQEVYDEADGPLTRQAVESTTAEDVAAATGEAVDRAISGTSSADVPRPLSASRGASDDGKPESHGVPCGTDGNGMPGSPREPDCTSDATQSIVAVEDVGQFRVAAPSASGLAAIGQPAGRIVLEPSRKRASLWQTGQWEIALPDCLGRAIGSAGPFDSVYHLQLVGAATADRETGSVRC